MSDYVDKDGKLTFERENVHRRIIDQILNGKVPVVGKAKMRMMGGGPASGKSSVTKLGLIEKFDDSNSIVIDPDEIKKMLPGYEEMSKTTDQAASYYHEESSALAKRLASVAFNENYNVTYDGTGDGSVGSVVKKINAARENGYEVSAVYVTIDTDEAVKRNHQRYLDGIKKGEFPRLVPEAYVRDCHRKVTNIAMECSDLFDKIELYDNNGEKGSTVLIGIGGNGKKLSPIKGMENLFNNFLSKGGN